MKVQDVLLPSNSDVNLLTIKRVIEPLAKSGPLEDDSGDQEIDGDGAVAVLFQECHQETETDEHHHVHILKHYFNFFFQIENLFTNKKARLIIINNHSYLDSSVGGCCLRFSLRWRPCRRLWRCEPLCRTRRRRQTGR